MTGAARARRSSGSPSARSGSCSSRGTRCRTRVLALGVACATSRRRTARRRCCRSLLHGTRLARAGRRPRSSSARCSALTTIAAARATALSRRRDRLRLSFVQGFAIGPPAGSSSRSPRIAGAAARAIRDGPRRRARRARRSRCCSRSGSPAAATSRATRSSPAASSRSPRWSRVFTFFPVARILISGAAGQRRRVLARGACAERLFTEKIWGLGCIAGDTRCGVAWNTLVLALLCAAGCTALGLAFALIATRTRLHATRACCACSSVLPIITPPFVIGLGLILLFGRSGLVNQLLEYAFGMAARRAGSTACRACCVAQVFAFTPIAFLVLIGVVEGVSPTHGGSGADAARRTAGACSPTSRCR